MSTMRPDGPQAPHWLVQLLRPAQAPVPWKRAARAAVAIAGPVAVGMAAGRLDLGVLASIGGLCATLADSDGPYVTRARRTGIITSAGAIGFAAGAAVSGIAWLTAVVTIVMAAASAVISAAGHIASQAGLQLLVFTIVGSGQPAPPLLAFGCFIAGAAFAMLLALAAWPMRPTAPERIAIADVYAALTEMLRAVGGPHARPARVRLTTKLNVAYDRLLGARSRLAGSDRTYRRLLTLLSRTTPVAEASVAGVAAGRKPDPALIEHLAEIGEAIRRNEPLPPQPPLEHGSTPLSEALRRLHSEDDDPHGLKPAESEPLRESLRRWRDTVTTGPVTWRYVLRLTACMALAELFILLLPLDHASWIALTVAIVLKPDFGSVFGRAMLRAGGTAIGVVLGAGVLDLAPYGWVLVVIMALVAAMLPITQVRNYGMFVTVVTPLVIVQLDLAHVGTMALVIARLADTAIGCLIVLVFGYLLWPGSRRAGVGDAVATAFDTIGEYMNRTLSGAPQGRSALRRRTYRQLSDLRTVFQRAIVEPSADGREASAWWPLIVSLERATDAVTRLAVVIERGEPPPDPADADTLRAALAEAAASVREHRKPGKVALPSSELLEPLVTDLDAVLRTLRGPARTRQRRTWRAGELLTRRRDAQPGSAG